MNIICSDLEGVFVPEIWINVAIKTGIEELKLTTRDISDYDLLMKRRLSILERRGLTIHDIQGVIEKMEPLDGALEFLEWLHQQTQVILVSDTFIQFAGPLMKKLGWPTLFCNYLSIDPAGKILDYHLRQRDGKRKAVQALKGLSYAVIAMGDSYNDVGMLQEADRGILFGPPDNVRKEFPQFPVTYTYDDLKETLRGCLDGLP
jgi:phosphoserine/homoserine phosphotransferase